MNKLCRAYEPSRSQTRKLEAVRQEFLVKAERLEGQEGHWSP